MKKILLTAIIILTAGIYCNAESRTFVREYYYQAGESDSKITSRTKALTEVKRLLLEEIGVYLESYINYSEEQDGDRISNQFLKKEIEQISAGITETTILEENWTGIEYYIKAEITVDPEDVVRQLNRSIEQRKASVVVDSLNMLLTEANTSIKAKEAEIASLRRSLENEQEKLRQQEDNLQRLNNELSGLKSRYSQIAKQEQAVQSEIDRIRRAFDQSTSKASQVLIGMNDEDVVRLCGQPRSIKMISSMAALDVYDAWNYGDITIIFDQTGCKYDNTLGLVIKGIRTDDLNRYGIDRCQNILGSLYSE
jgi:predicted Holliday junction resolvase-like endonuclease